MSEQSRPGVDRRRTTKLGIVGAGSVGATVAYAALMRGVARTVALFDINPVKVEAEVLDLGHGIQFMPNAQIVGSDHLSVLADSDVIVVTAGAKQKPGQSRLDLADATVRLVRELMPQLVDVAPDAVFIMVTNPVDIVTYAAIRTSDLEPGRVFGSGTVLDSSRLRWLVAQHCNVSVQSVHATIAGEHGDTEIPLWSSAAIGSVPLLNWRGTKTGNGPFDQTVRNHMAEEVVGSAYRIIEGKGATNYAIAQAATRIVEAVLKDEKSILPVSSLLTDYYGISDVCLSVPAVVGRGGVEARLEIPMSGEEMAGLRHSAEHLREVAHRFGW
jgi:L-lactate dehydrogenase